MVGAVAETQHPLSDPATCRPRPAAPPSSAAPRRQAGPRRRLRPARQRRPRPGGGPLGAFGAYDEDDFDKPGRGRKWLKRTLIAVAVLAVIGGGLYGG